MEAAPRLPMLSFDLKVCTENTQFAPQLKQYIATFYNEDPDSYQTEIHNLESLRAVAVRPSMDVNGVQLLKKYYCQLHFLKSRFPMEENQDAAVQFLWKDNQAGMNCGGSDIRFELMVIMYNIGALHSYLGATDSRSNPDGMKMACTHFQCAAWAFQTVKEKYHQFIIYISSVELIHFFQQVCLAQAQECILEKSMLDNRKATITAKVAVQVYNYYRQSLTILQSTSDELIGSKTYKEWIKYLQFKVAYHKCIALLFQGQQAEEQQKMGERVAFYQAACEQLEEARKLSTSLKNRQQEIVESLAFTLDVVEGKRKAAKNENEFIYHEEVPDLDQLQEVKGALLVKGIAFSVNDAEVSGPDIFSRLVPMEAHEAASLYSEKKAQMLRQIGELVENKDQSLVEFMSSMQLDLLTKMSQATGIPQELIDRAAALSAKPNATKDLVDAMGKLSSIYQDVESNLNEIDGLLKEEEEAEKSYQELMGKRPPSIIATDLAREAAKYREAHTKANDSNQTLHRAMTAHIANLKILQQPLRQLQQQLPSVELPNPNIDEKALKDLETLVAKVDEMRTQRAMLWAQFRESVHKDDITNSLVTKQPNQSLEQLFQQELQKHQQLAGLIEQNCTAQENIRKALVDSYAQAINTRRYVQDIIQKRTSTISALISSHDSYDDLLAKANKGIEFYTKLDTNVSKLLQRIKSACKVQQEEREQILSKNDIPKQEDTSAHTTPASTAPKLKDYLESRKKNPVATYPDPNLQYHQTMNYGLNVSQNMPDTQTWPPAVRPTPLGSEVTDLPKSSGYETYNYPSSSMQYGYGQVQPSTTAAYPYHSTDGYANQQQTVNSGGFQPAQQVVDQELINRMNNLLSNIKNDSRSSQNNTSSSYSNYIPQNYASTTYAYSTQAYTPTTQVESSVNSYDPNKAYTTTTNSYRPLSSYTVPNNTNTHMQYPDSSLGSPATSGTANDPANSNAYQYPSYTQQPQNVPHSQQPTQTSTPNTYSQTNINAYYPVGYGPNYSSPQGDVNNVSAAGQAQYHSLEYATSVQPNQVNYSYNSTYSSPVVNMSSAHARDANYMATSAAAAAASQAHSGYSAAASAIGNQQTYSNTSTPSLEQANPSTPYSTGVGYANQPAYAAGSVQSGTYPTSGVFTASVTQQSYSNPQSYQTGSISSTSYQLGSQQSYESLQSHQSDGSASYPVGASTAVIGSTGTQPSYTPNAQYYPAGNAIAGSYHSYPAAAATADPQQTYQNVSGTAYSNYYGENYSQNYPTNYNYSSPANVQPQAQQEKTINAPLTTKKSNVDLLSGLDFTISQAPLIPQQNVMQKPEESVAKPANSETKPNLTKRASLVKDEKPLPEIKRLSVKILPSKPLSNVDVKNLFIQEVEKYEKYIETLTNKTLSGPTNLDIKWKEIQDKQEGEGQKKIISVARCYPMKNRFPDILPYDYSRVELRDAKDDYINASYVKDVSPYAPPFIVAQSPLPSTFADFWTMIREQQVELIFCVSNDNEIGDDVYWPREKGQHLNILNMVISLQSVIIKSHWVERLISVNLPEKRDSWVVMHLQFTSWPGSLFPTSPEPFVGYVLELITLYQQQRCATHPVVVHCSSGIGKSGLVCLLTAAIFDVTNNANSTPDLASLATKLTNCRKNILRDREHLKFAYEAFLAYMKQVVSQEKLKKKLNEVVPKLQEENKQSIEIVEKNTDPLSTLDPFWASKK